MIDVKNITKRYNGTVVLDGVSLSLPAGGVISLIGANGAGKSTLLSIISRLLPMSSGTVEIDGLDVTTTPGEVLARRLSILRQDNQIMSRLTVEDLVAFGRYPHSKGRLTDEDRKHIAKALRYLDLEPLAGRFLDELSGGQRQRAFIAMVLCQDTEYILLDEPLNNLDVKHAVAMMKLFRRTADEFGKTVVLVLHDINFASCYSDRIVAMRDGRVVHQGPPEAIITPDVIRDVYGVEAQVMENAGQRIALYYQ
ncbi:iron ABC transporter ATP-binding protein (plasmid) [Azospirillum baldaniorum]|uniref:Iron-dicitrate ABC transporter ATP-binding component n=1 Tax=Azospirillum baldaniorum TaxID=1064539 RepID=A0A9P1JVM0_9PROT|nr:ABC transporter ATP-binding protein [Azospirillum baldaniorum]AWJ92150.1 iron ABC transporter ATP-binding protein [Azospirillum baldaniorum]TWA73588.1 iron complex transport system ATP-binding protein [Azospirillum brasilense]CCD00630.1 iron-dicitrate ABC transporter; ATP-binding component [Azospirillum baldaniorum]